MTFFIFCILPYLSVVLTAFGWTAVYLKGRTAHGRSNDRPRHCVSSGGVTIPDRLIQRLVFENTRRRNFFSWLLALFFHGALILVLLRHLRYLWFPVPDWLETLQGPGIAAGYILPVLLIIILFRRLLAKSWVVSSTWLDYLVICLLLAASLTGLGVRFIWRTDVSDVKHSLLSLIWFQPQPPDQPGAMLLAHAFLGMLILVCRPYFRPVKRRLEVEFTGSDGEHRLFGEERIWDGGDR
jgi:nitrate reductase gamma subunit